MNNSSKKAFKNKASVILLLLLMMIIGPHFTQAMQTGPSGSTIVSRESGEQNIMLVRDVTAQAGDIITIEVEIINDSEFVGFNLYLLLPEGFSYVENTSQLYRTDDHDYGFVVDEDTNIARIIAFSITNSPFLGNEGVIFSLDVETPAEPGEYFLAITNAVMGNDQMQDVLTGTQNGVVSLLETETFALTLLADPPGGGVLSGGGIYQPEETVNVSAAANDGYSFLQWTDAEGALLSDEPAFLFVMPDRDVDLIAEFAINTYIITATAGANGSISPTGSIMVEHGDDQGFIITPNEGYYIADVLVDGESVGAVSEYVFEDVAGDHTIHAEFAIEEDPGDILHIARDEDVVVDGIACFYTLSSIMVAGEAYEFIVEAGGEATLAAGEMIRLLPGTIVESGGYLLAFITDEGPCGRPFAREELPAKDALITSIDVVDKDTDGSLFFKLYPNPAQTEVTIKLGSLINDSDIRIEIYSLMGERVYSEQLPARNSYMLSLADLQAGVYVVRVHQGNTVAVERLIKR